MFLSLNIFLPRTVTLCFSRYGFVYSCVLLRNTSSFLQFGTVPFLSRAGAHITTTFVLFAALQSLMFFMFAGRKICVNIQFPAPIIPSVVFESGSGKVGFPSSSYCKHLITISQQFSMLASVNLKIFLNSQWTLGTSTAVVLS